MRFVAFGELMLDVDIVTGADAHAATIRVRAGGTAANAAAWAAAAGADAVCAGRIGADAAGVALEAALRRAGVTPHFTVDPDLPTGTVALVDGGLAVDRGANRALAADDLPPVEHDALLVSGYALAGTAEAATRALERSPARVRVLTGGSASLIRSNRDAFARMAAAATLHVVDEAEAAALGPAAGADVCVTRGAAGAVLRLDGREVSATGSGSGGDAPGAGDAVAATLAVALARGVEPGAALEAACVAGARAATSPTGWP